jgi:3-polyprenyl-4-hydroxybenzoate decarboxylase
LVAGWWHGLRAANVVDALRQQDVDRRLGLLHTATASNTASINNNNNNDSKNNNNKNDNNNNNNNNNNTSAAAASSSSSLLLSLSLRALAPAAAYLALAELDAIPSSARSHDALATKVCYFFFLY